MGGPPRGKGKQVGPLPHPCPGDPGPPKPPEMREGLGGKCLGVRGSKAWPYRNLNKHSPIATHCLQPWDF